MKNSYLNAKVKLYAIAIIIASLLINACKEPDDIGLNVQPQGDLLNVVFSDTTSIVAYTFIEDSLQTNGANYNLLGSIKDPIFGKVNASFCTQFELSSYNIKFGNAASVDSMILALAYIGYYGDTNTTQNVKVYELNELLSKNDSIYSNHNVQYDIFTELANYSFQPKPTTKVKVDTTTEVAQLRIRLSNSLAEKFLRADTTSNSGVYGNVTNFQNFFKGLFITTTPVNSDGAVCNFYLKKVDSNNKLVSKLIIYYHNSEKDSLSQSFYIANNCIKFNKFEHYNYQDASQILKDQINGNKSLGDSLLYMQSLAGLAVKLKFPYLQNWYSKGNILINRAELVIPVEEDGTYIDDYFAPTALGLAGNDSASNYYRLIDSYSATFFGGSYNKTKKEYSFNITRQLQHFLSTNDPKNGLYLTITSSVINASRVIIKGSKRSVGRLRLNLTYTKLN